MFFFVPMFRLGLEMLFKFRVGWRLQLGFPIWDLTLEMFKSTMVVHRGDLHNAPLPSTSFLAVDAVILIVLY